MWTLETKILYILKGRVQKVNGKHYWIVMELALSTIHDWVQTQEGWGWSPAS